MPDPTPAVDVDAIRARAEEYHALMDGDAEPSDYDAMRLAFATAADIPALLDALAAARAEVEQLRAWQREVCDVGFGYDADEPGNAAEVLAYLPIWKAEGIGVEAERDAARAALAALREVVEGVPEALDVLAEHIQPMVEAASLATLEHVADTLRAALTATPALAAVADHPGLADVLRAHGWEHIGVVDGTVWCATDGATIGKATPEGIIPDSVVYAHQADRVRAWAARCGTSTD